MRGEASNPACPRCGYDLIGLVETWTEACPLEARCSECGGVSPAAALYRREMLGPRWSLEHATRRFVRKWLATTLISLRPGRLWREMRADHRVMPRRLVLMAALWLMLVHLACGGVLGLSWLSLAIFAPDNIEPWDPVKLGQWRFWGDVGRRVAWPYNRDVVVPLSSSSSFMTRLHFFVVLNATALLMMGVIAFLVRRRGGPGRVHFARAFTMVLPSIAVWTVIGHAAFAVGGHLAFPGTHDWIATLIALGGFVWFAVYMIWWWRCFAAHYLGDNARSWVLMPLGLVALVIAVVVAVAVDVFENGNF